MADKVIVCKDCGKEFTFTERGQEFFASKGYSDPVRCKSCRKARQGKRESR